MGCARWLALGGLLALAGLLQARLLLPQQEGFGECDRFFYAGTPPAGLATEAHVRICQRFAGSEHFATLYSPVHRIPVFSAFRAALPAPRSAEQRGLLEPQVSRARPGGVPKFKFVPVSPYPQIAACFALVGVSTEAARAGGPLGRWPSLLLGAGVCSVWLVSWVAEDVDWETALRDPDPADLREAQASQARGHPLSGLGPVGKFTPFYRKQLQAQEVEVACRRPPSW